MHVDYIRDEWEGLHQEAWSDMVQFLVVFSELSRDSL